MAEITRLLLVRHGQSTWNAERRWQGQANPPLSDHGRFQAKEAAKAIGAIDAIAASPQLRARHTAELIAGELGIGPVVLIPGLRERGAGPWSGMTVEEIEARYPGYLADHRRPEGYESDAALLDRTKPALDALAVGNPGRLILVVTHGGVIHRFEEYLGLNSGRVPNLWGRVIEFTPAGSGAGEWRAGERLELIEGHHSTGGDAKPV
ncbi:MAG: histidine phosphatase family protein [Actinomycetota bacterium]|nr:histidine phosphatase family protein [Actinomycetota bacterium]